MLRITELGCVVAAFVIAVMGCSGGGSLPDTLPVTGLVTYKGEPLADANVSFIPSQGKPASGTTGPEGRFELTTFQPGDGAIVGEHTVTVAKTVPVAGQEDDPYAEHKSVIPEKYGKVRESGLKAIVTADGPNEFNFDLTE